MIREPNKVIRQKKVVSPAGNVYFVDVLMDKGSIMFSDIKIDLYVGKGKVSWWNRGLLKLKWVYSEEFSYNYQKTAEIKENFIIGIEYAIRQYENNLDKNKQERDKLADALNATIQWDGKLGD